MDHRKWCSPAKYVTSHASGIKRTLSIPATEAIINHTRITTGTHYNRRAYAACGVCGIRMIRCFDGLYRCPANPSWQAITESDKTTTPLLKDAFYDSLIKIIINQDTPLARDLQNIAEQRKFIAEDSNMSAIRHSLHRLQLVLIGNMVTSDAMI